jgi:hypothetical protein
MHITFDPNQGRISELAVICATLLTWALPRLVWQIKSSWGIYSSVPLILLGTVLASVVTFFIQGFLALTGLIWLLVYVLIAVTAHEAAERLLRPF